MLACVISESAACRAAKSEVSSSGIKELSYQCINMFCQGVLFEIDLRSLFTNLSDQRHSAENFFECIVHLVIQVLDSHRVRQDAT